MGSVPRPPRPFMTHSTERDRLLSAARRAGHTDPLTADAIDAFLDPGPVAPRVATKRARLARDGIVETEVAYPSSRVDGRVAEFLKAVEKENSNLIFDGTVPEHWVAAAVYVDSYLSMEDRAQYDVGGEYGCHAKTISTLYPKLVGTETFDRFYGSALPIPDRLSALLRQRRASIGMMAHRLRETRIASQARVDALSRWSDSSLHSEEFGGKEFFWVEEQ